MNMEIENIKGRLIDMEDRIRSYMSILSPRSRKYRKWMSKFEETVAEKFPEQTKYMNP